MVEAAPPKPQAASGGSGADQAFNAYGAAPPASAHASAVYTSPPSNPGHAAGGYGSMYGTNYGF